MSKRYKAIHFKLKELQGTISPEEKFWLAAEKHFNTTRDSIVNSTSEEKGLLYYKTLDNDGDVVICVDYYIEEQ